MMDLPRLEVYIMYEISRKNYHNLNRRYFKISEKEFESNLNELREMEFIGGNTFKGNGIVKKEFNYYYLTEKGERYLRTGQI